MERRMKETDGGRAGARAPRRPWADRWLLDAFKRLGFPAVDRLSGEPSDSAWEALALAGASTEQLIETACAVSARPAADLAPLGPEQAALLDRTLAARYGVVPVGERGNRLEVATANPLHPTLEQELQFAAGRRITLAVASPGAIAEAHVRIYADADAAVTTPLGAPATRLSWIATKPAGPDEPVPIKSAAVAQLDMILADALDAGASDVHFEPKGRGLHVRIRVDGILHEVAEVPLAYATSIISRLKILAGLDIADRLRPQDGRASTVYDGRAIDLRISTLPLGSGEKAVVRVLDSKSSTVSLDRLGFSHGERYRFEKLLQMREGMVLVTGATGSGKTTTLYSALRHVQSPETNIVTVEDPIEYRLEGVNQVQVHEKSGLTFAAALRSILRQDPDVVLVGEIRDGETAGIAIKASMTGHLVLSTLHTNDAPSAVGRLQDIGVDMGALAGALKGVVAQRLVRRLCTECSAPLAFEELTAEQQQLLAGQKTVELRKAVGCDACRGTGYRGRMVVAEIILVTPELQKAIARGADVNELGELARRGGMKSLWESGRDKVVAGWTSLHELLDNVAPPLADPVDQAMPAAPAATPAPAAGTAGEAGPPASAATQSEIDALVARLTAGEARAPEPAPRSRRSGPVLVPTEARELQPATGLRVLVVEDGREERRLLREALEGEGIAVIEAADGEAGLAYARRLRPDVVVAEIALPRLDAVGLLQALRAEPGAPPLVVYTEQTDAALLAWLGELGAAEVLARPTDARVLAACLAAHARPPVGLREAAPALRVVAAP
jgi:type II secretory ATPase GspE/PulE/Tfp pilus assembly ATPase PilB-like protein/ActR/RegA family two-component response regulator